jgi:acyl-coenzyme A synthetase/AMP-(fatty) acid ligase
MSKSGTANNAAVGGESKLKNEILARWDAVLSRKADFPAVKRSSGEVAFTFAQLDELAWRVAADLKDVLSADEVVALQAPNHPEWPALVLAIWRSGCCPLLLDYAAGEASRDAAERACGARARLEIPTRGRHLVTPLAHPQGEMGDAAPELIKLTSGTTGVPRAILFTSAQIAADCDQVCETMGIRESDWNYGVVAFSHSYGFSNLITPLLCRGVPLVAAEDALPRAVISGVAASRATVLPAVPAVFHALSAVEGTMPSLRLCISAGAPLRPDTARAFRERFGLKVHVFYGASECGGISYDTSEGEELKAGFVGQPMRGVRIEKLEDGGIAVHSAAVGQGYFPATDSDDPLSDGIFRPVDILEETPNGWRIVGRRSDIINVGGKKVNPSEVENVLLEHPAVREAVVFGVQCDARSQAICACVVATDEIGEGELRAYCAARLATWQVPRSIIQLDALPVNARGKISRAELAKRYDIRSDSTK